jgi:hypothetical protein
LLVALAQQHPDNDKYNNGGEASSSQFFCAPGRYEAPKKVVHRYIFQINSACAIRFDEAINLPDITVQQVQYFGVN